MSHHNRSAEFNLSSWRVSAGKIIFAYECSRFGPFTETLSAGVALPDPLPAAMIRLLDLLHAALGVSYYKAGAALTINFPAFAECPKAQAMVRHLYREGMGEFFVRNELDYPPKQDFTFAAKTQKKEDEKKIKSILPPLNKDQALVAFGGGKDSYVAEAISSKAGLQTKLVSVVLSEKVAQTLSSLSQEKITFIQRRLDDKLRALPGEEKKSFNGHVPITAINILSLELLALIEGQGSVIFANERSADEPTMWINNQPVNHQYSKSAAFEKLLAEAIDECAPKSMPHFFSVLRPWSEIWIAAKLAQRPSALAHFSSCNRNFPIEGRQTQRWCGHCAKCAFTALLLAPFMAPTKMIAIFGDDFLARPALDPYFRDILGLGEKKPWDCVGTIDESQACLWHLSQIKEWQEHMLVKKNLAAILHQHTEKELADIWQQSLEPAAHDRIPKKLFEAARCLD